jgi:hypothetical protein
MTVARQTEALLALVEADRAAKCAAVLDAAREQADAIRRDAHAAARERMRAAFAEERGMRAARVAAARANLETRRRIALQRRSAALLAAAWQALPAALAKRWGDEDGRAAWVAATVADARRVLHGDAWRVAHAGGWPEAERAALASRLAAEGVAVSFEESAARISGLRIAAGGNVVDATGEGLLSDRAEIGALLLVQLGEAA